MDSSATAPSSRAGSPTTTSSGTTKTTISSGSAAVHGIALLDPDTSRVHTTNSRAGGAKTVHRFVHPGPLRDADVVEVHSASVGESWSRAQMIEADPPAPDLQKYYLLPEQDAWVDFDWSRVLVGEFDGEGKYLGGLRADDERGSGGAAGKTPAGPVGGTRPEGDPLDVGHPPEGRARRAAPRYWLRHFSLLG